MLGSTRIKKDEVDWTFHEKELPDDKCNKRNDKWKERERGGTLHLTDNIKVRGRHDLTKRRTDHEKNCQPTEQQIMT